jgi:hypothetical protein
MCIYTTPKVFSTSSQILNSNTLLLNLRITFQIHVHVAMKQPLILSKLKQEHFYHSGI